MISHSIMNGSYKWGGTAMGKKFAPNYANLFMAQWEREALAKWTKQPLCYFRFLDDIFIICHTQNKTFRTSLIFLILTIPISNEQPQYLKIQYRF